MAPHKTLQAPKAPRAPRKPRTAKPSTSIPKSVRKAATQVPPRLQEILDEFKTLDQVHFDLFQPKEYRKPYTNLPSSFPTNPYPIDFFNLFFTDSLFKTIITNSNRYTASQRYINSDKRRRKWKDLILDEQITRFYWSNDIYGNIL